MKPLPGSLSQERERLQSLRGGKGHTFLSLGHFHPLPSCYQEPGWFVCSYIADIEQQSPSFFGFLRVFYMFLPAVLALGITVQAARHVFMAMVREMILTVESV